MRQIFDDKFLLIIALAIIIVVLSLGEVAWILLSK
jgi:hypothetical protein